MKASGPSSGGGSSTSSRSIEDSERHRPRRFGRSGASDPFGAGQTSRRTESGRPRPESTDHLVAQSTSRKPPTKSTMIVATTPSTPRFPPAASRLPPGHGARRHPPPTDRRSDPARCPRAGCPLREPGLLHRARTPGRLRGARLPRRVDPARARPTSLEIRHRACTPRREPQPRATDDCTPWTSRKPRRSRAFMLLWREGDATSVATVPSVSARRRRATRRSRRRGSR